MTDRLDVFKRLESIDSLPTLPDVAAQLLDMLGDNNTSMTDVAKIVAVDPSLTSKVLKIANSPMYGLRNKVDTIRLALVILGIEEVSNILLSISLFKTFDNLDEDARFDKEQFWEHSVGVAHIARVLSRELKIKMHGEEFTAGLIHDIGKIILEQYFHEEFLEVLDKVDAERSILYEAEEAILGTNHMEIGAWIADKWKLPINLVESIRYHHHPENSEDGSALAAIINLADLFAKSASIGQLLSYEVLDIEGSPSWDILKTYSPKTLEFDVQRFTLLMEDEIEKIKEFMEFAQ